MARGCRHRSNTRFILPSQFGPPQDAHISVSAPETFHPPRHIVVCGGITVAGLWLRLSVEGRLGVNHDENWPSLFHFV